MNLMKVRANRCILVFPYDFPEHARIRGTRGYVVDLDAPCEAEWCKGQEHKLEPAPEATEATKIVHPQALALIRKEVARRAANPEQSKEPVAVGASVGGEESSESLEVARPVAKRKAS